MNDTDTTTLMRLADRTAMALQNEREKLFNELLQMIQDEDHPSTIEAKALAIGLVEGASHIAFALARGLYRVDNER